MQGYVHRLSDAVQTCVRLCKAIQCYVSVLLIDFLNASKMKVRKLKERRNIIALLHKHNKDFEN